MLADHPIYPMIPATDLAVAGEFYGERIGLGVIVESDDFLRFRSGTDDLRDAHGEGSWEAPHGPEATFELDCDLG
jgi:hypothetical protein